MMWARIAVVVAVLTPACFGWGREGHRMVATLATQHLSAKARAEVARLLDGDSLASVASWADDVRPKRAETSTWHYINIPVSEPRGEWKAYCPAEGCVETIIPQMMARLRDKSKTKAERAEALKFLVHFMADAHQPLHVGDSRDRGGNDVAVVIDGKETNLHTAWDSTFLRAAIAKDAGLEARWSKAAGYFERRRAQRGSLEAWMWEARDVSRDVAYGKLGAARPAAVGDEYAKAVVEVEQAQIRLAGLRLARVLNEVLGRTGGE